MFPNVDKLFTEMFTYTPLTEEQFQASCVDDVIEWADAISSEWNGDESGSQEDRAHCADEIIGKLNEVKALIAEMGEL